jgi:hypothetical protein
VSLLAGHFERGRRFAVHEIVERGDAMVVGLRLTQPDWSGSVDVFKVFTFGPGVDRVVRMQDCTDREAAVSAASASPPG